MACLIRQGAKETRPFSTLSDDLLRLSDWLVTAGCTPVVLESTGVEGQPASHLLERQMEGLLVQARHGPTVPGRKTEVKDSAGLADLLRHGLWRGSFRPPAPIREVRERVRYRTTLVRERVNVANRIQKLCARAKLKLAQVASEALGVSGLAMLRHGRRDGRGQTRRTGAAATPSQNPGVAARAARAVDGGAPLGVAGTADALR